MQSTRRRFCKRTELSVVALRLGVPGVDLFDPKGRLGWCMSRVKEGMRVEEIRKEKRGKGKRRDGGLERIYGWIGKDEMDG